MTAAPSTHAESDRDLLRRYHEDGDLAARDALVGRHLGLARALSRRYAGRGEAIEDIEQVAAIGLIKAIDRYDASRGFALTTFATPTVLGEIKRHFRDRAWTIRVPRHIQELNGKTSRAVERLTTAIGRSPTIAEIASEAGASAEEVLEALEAGSAYSPASLSSSPGGGEDELDPMDWIGADDAGYRLAEARTTLEPALGELSEREQAILALRFEEGLTQTQIAARMGISQMHVSRLIRRALDALREGLD